MVAFQRDPESPRVYKFRCSLQDPSPIYDTSHLKVYDIPLINLQGVNPVRACDLDALRRSSAALWMRQALVRCILARRFRVSRIHALLKLFYLLMPL